MELSEAYILNALYTYSGDPTLNKYDGNYNCGCPICREGNSWGKKKRLFYYPATKSFFCFNCSESWSAKNWIMEVTGLSYAEMMSEDSENSFSQDVSDTFRSKIYRKPDIPSLPFDSVNISELTQQKYYQNNIYVQRALTYIEKRRLATAINHPKAFYMSFTDRIHKNRLVIPFYDRSGHVIFYQTRSLDNTEPRYLGKMGHDKTVFGIDKVDPDFEYIFITEGPIDAMFIRNGVAVAGLTLSETQENQLNEFPFHQKIWVLDNISITKDKETKDKTIKLLNQSEKVYNWKDVKYKDFNDWAVAENLDMVDPNRIIKNLYC